LGILITAIFLLILGILLFQKFRDNKTLRLQKEEITLQRNILDVQNKKITDSIHYGLRIQQAMLPNIDEIRSIFQTMIIYKPKDIVSGDFYWFYKIIKKDITEVFLAVIDCTGHGVPGAFMSMIGHRLLTEIVVEQKNYQPSIILEEIDQKLKIELHQDNNKSMDGMDVAFCRVTISPNQETRLIFAGAKRPLYIQRKTESEILILEGNHKSIGGYKSKTDNPFTDKTSTLNTGDRIFMFTDGIIDQQNQFRDRFGSTRLNSLITEGFKEPLSKTKENIEVSLDNFRGTEDQRDDITIVGLQIN
jgi:serine phosphatase RsbU (regulator of sigma subunit)